MVNELLYKKAFEYRKTNLWKILWDDQIFAVKFSDKQIGYCCVMGANGEHLALGVYIGEEGIKSYLRLAGGFINCEDWDDIEKSVSQSCLMCSFVSKNELDDEEFRAIKICTLKLGYKINKMNQFPQFQKFIPNHFPWKIETELEEQYMSEAFDAAFEVLEKLKTKPLNKLHLDETPHLYGRTIPLLKKKKDGSYNWGTTVLPEESDYEYEMAELYDELAYAKVKRMKVQNMTWACGLIRLPRPYIAEKGQAPAFPLAQLIVDEDSGMICNMHISNDGSAADFPNILLDTITNMGKPKKIKMVNIRTLALYSDFVQNLGIQIPFKEKSTLFNKLAS